ncbi:mycofactocin biosynthesis peptidyl-dipeptidase MftE [Streptomyces sp. NBC_01235]|uniref:mycofactocin biosynthesis peptidyl-dipeptidase MftE n=1 Tax=Streptomyces sp. NBC_01235 TaxID=2903788 RepID=UPI002E0FE2B2|nr:mycofactocin biosynthesis peptidyl-dipeptidase MftE [Streptomyces sp. NBC_01235]
MTELASLTWPELARRERDGPVLAVPVGATEQHGPHLPLSTDTDIAVALAERLAQEVPGVVVAPPVAFGSSGEHQEFAGTLSIGQEAVELLLLELVRSACATFPRTVLVSAHGGNAEPVSRAVRRLREEGRHVLAWSPRWGGDAHAGRTETSVMLALAPHRVLLERAEAGNTTPVGELLPLLRGQGLKAATANGVLGDPAGASAEEGRALLSGAAQQLAALVSGRAAGTGTA